ncbi:hypothetical protein CP157_03656 (plasmid) [Paracoccus marcusii]|nr:hypothetical protein CP157_03656 [Paracoccus marcusii]
MVLRIKRGQSLLLLMMAAFSLNFLHAVVQGPFGLLELIQIKTKIFND